MDNDDQQIGRILTRREVLALLGGSATTLLIACGPAAGSSATVPPATATTVPSTATTAAGAATAPPVSPTSQPASPVTGGATATATGAAAAVLPSCIVRPAQTEGPYFVDERLNRADIRTDPSDGSVRPGVPFQLTFRVGQVDSSGCRPLAGATVDVWHCDAVGVYSDVTDRGVSTVGKKFLRGYQTTTADGTAQFTTIYPGWYQGRAVHIHFKIRAAAAGRNHDFTSQLYFDEALSAKIFSQAPYASKGTGWMRNAADGIYRSDGSQLLLALTETANGYTATFDIGLQLS